MDINSVIYHGHMVKQPLIRLPSELVDRLEPHGYFRSSAGAVLLHVRECGGEVVYPGWCSLGGYLGGVYRVQTQPSD